eukprot:1353741-Rhodomonas_salina.3
MMSQSFVLATVGYLVTTLTLVVPKLSCVGRLELDAMLKKSMEWLEQDARTDGLATSNPSPGLARRCAMWICDARCRNRAAM